VNALGKLCRRLCKALNLPRFRPHDLGRTASSLLGQHGWSDDMIGKLLAHDSDTVTAKHYNNNALAYLSEKREMVLLLEQLLGKRCATSTATPQRLITSSNTAPRRSAGPRRRERTGRGLIGRAFRFQRTSGRQNASGGR
jgi:hypothetical protein